MTIKTIARGFLEKAPLLDGVFRRFVWSRVHFPEMEMRFLDSLPAGALDIAVDVGAALGSYAWILDRKARRVYSFEPGEVHYRYLSRLLWSTNISLTRSAVGASCGVVQFFTPGSDSNARHSATLSASNPVIRRDDTQVTEVPLVTLDDFFRERLRKSDRIDFLKVDVEGYELEVFKGAAAILATHRPLIVCEIEARHNAQYGQVFALLRGTGYDCYVYRGRMFEPFRGEHIEEFQREADLAVRLSPEYDPARNRYINNFVFQHPDSRIKVSQ
jgi:FkbM family methyltransferase